MSKTSWERIDQEKNNTPLISPSTKKLSNLTSSKKLPNSYVMEFSTVITLLSLLMGLLGQEKLTRKLL